MRITQVLLLIFGLALQGCQCQDDTGTNQQSGTTFLGRLFGGFFGNGIISILPTITNENEGGSPARETPNDTGTSENMQFITCTQSTACYNDSTQTPGAWTCRPQYVGHVSLCVPTLLGVTLGREGDTCGCCDGICPKKCECGCVNSRGVEGVMARFNLLFGLIQFEQCLEPTVADAATSFSTLDISCSEVCKQQGQTDVSKL